MCKCGKTHDGSHCGVRSTPGGQLQHADSGPDKTVCNGLPCLLIVCDDFIEDGDKPEASSLVIWLAVAASTSLVGQNRPDLVRSRLANVFVLLLKAFINLLFGNWKFPGFELITNDVLFIRDVRKWVLRGSLALLHNSRWWIYCSIMWFKQISLEFFSLLASKQHAKFSAYWFVTSLYRDSFRVFAGLLWHRWNTLLLGWKRQGDDHSPFSPLLMGKSRVPVRKGPIKV